MAFIDIASYAQNKNLGQRHSARPIRALIVTALNADHPITLNFKGISATQSFTDELIGQLILERGPNILKLISFKGCSMEMRGIITFVIKDRTHQYLTSNHQNTEEFDRKRDLAYAY